MQSTVTYTKKQAITWVLFTVLLVLFLDQSFKIYIKTHFELAHEINVIGTWFKLHFTENPGMAFGILPFGGAIGKVLLTVFRIIASAVIIYYLRNLIREKAKAGLLILVSLILAGAVGNILDSVFYGILFSESSYHTIAEFMPAEGGYAPLLMGKVVDMLYFPVIDTFLPEWVPFIGGNRFQFFRPVFNIADSAISIGVFTIILFRKRLFVTEHHETEQEEEIKEEFPGTGELNSED